MRSLERPQEAVLVYIGYSAGNRSTRSGRKMGVGIWKQQLIITVLLIDARVFNMFTFSGLAVVFDDRNLARDRNECENRSFGGTNTMAWVAEAVRRAYERDYVIICTYLSFTRIPTCHKTLRSKVMVVMVIGDGNRTFRLQVSSHPWCLHCFQIVTIHEAMISGSHMMRFI